MSWDLKALTGEGDEVLTRMRREVDKAFPAHKGLHGALEVWAQGESAVVPGLRLSKSTFTQMAEDEGWEALASLIRSGVLGLPDLSYALEILGVYAPLGVTQELCGLYLRHEKPFVREGAVYGLGMHLKSPGVRRRLAELLAVETSPGVRDATLEVLSHEHEFPSGDEKW